MWATSIILNVLVASFLKSLETGEIHFNIFISVCISHNYHFNMQSVSKSIKYSALFLYCTFEMYCMFTVRTSHSEQMGFRVFGVASASVLNSKPLD